MWSARKRVARNEEGNLCPSAESKCTHPGKSLSV